MHETFNAEIESYDQDDYSSSQGSDSWVISYLDVLTLLLAFLVIMLGYRSVPQTEQPALLKPPELQVTKDKAVEFSVLPITREKQSEKLISTTKASDSVAPNKQETVLQKIAHEAVILGFEMTRGASSLQIEINNVAIFTSGSATLNEQGHSILGRFAELIVTQSELLVTVEGHTDDVPVQGRHFSSNWELASARALSVVNFFLAQGVLAPYLRAVSYGDTFPLVSNATEEGRARNRRVNLMLSPISKRLTTPIQVERFKKLSQPFIKEQFDSFRKPGSDQNGT